MSGYNDPLNWRANSNRLWAQQRQIGMEMGRDSQKSVFSWRDTDHPWYGGSDLLQFRSTDVNKTET